MMHTHAAPSSAATTYQAEEIAAADPLGLVARVFELAASHMARARAALAAGDARNKGLRIHDASRCLSTLHGCLDMERGGEVAQNLDRLYAYFQIRLTQGHLRDDDEALAEVAAHLTELARAWRGVTR